MENLENIAPPLGVWALGPTFREGAYRQAAQAPGPACPSLPALQSGMWAQDPQRGQHPPSPGASPDQRERPCTCLCLSRMFHAKATSIRSIIPSVSGRLWCEGAHDHLGAPVHLSLSPLPPGSLGPGNWRFSNSGLGLLSSEAPVLPQVLEGVCFRGGL